MEQEFAQALEVIRREMLGNTPDNMEVEHFMDGPNAVFMATDKTNPGKWLKVIASPPMVFEMANDASK